MRGRGLGACGAAVCLVAILLAGCGGDRAPAAEPASTGSKVALIGWDGATWAVIEPLLAAGELPNLERLLERGARGVLRADPPILSPVVWTTISTGFPPAEHGVTGFQLPDPASGNPVLAATFHRRRAPLWHMASAGGKRVGFVGWWTTWPAEPVLGYVVSDHVAYNRWDAWARRPEGDAYHLTFPPALAGGLERLAVRPDALEPEAVLELAHFNDAERQEMLAATRPVMFHAPSVLRFGYATDASNLAFARHLLEAVEQPDLFGLTFILSDVAGHVFWHTLEPQLYPIDPASVAHLAESIPNVYRKLDEWTGRLLERLEPDTVVVVLSDHGMGAKRVLPRPGVTPSGDHEPDGILVFSGPGVPPGADLGVRSQLDMAPTVLALLGLPVAEDMPGRAIEALLRGGREPAPRIATYGDGRSVAVPEHPSPAAEDYEERLRSLGYIQ